MLEGELGGSLEVSETGLREGFEGSREILEEECMGMPGGWGEPVSEERF